MRKHLVIAAIAITAALAGQNQAKAQTSAPAIASQEPVQDLSARRGHRHSRRHARRHHGARHGQHARHRHAPSGMVTAQTAMGPITGAPSFIPKAAALIGDMVAMGINASRVHCLNFAHTHVGRSNHYTGHACDFDGSANRFPPMNRHRMADLIHKHGLRDGCDFGDCGHVDDAHNLGGLGRWNVAMAARGKRHYAHHRHHHRHYRLARAA